MKAKLPFIKEVNITHVIVELPVRYEEEDITNDFPLRRGDMWAAKIEMDTGQIECWPVGKSGRLNMKVCDEGIYQLIDENGMQLAKIQDYVPHGVIPGRYGDYVDLHINDQGIITNWPKKPDVVRFLRREEEE